MESVSVLRTALIFVHLLLSAFALQCVLSSDWRLLFGHVSQRRIATTHWVLLRLLTGLWLTGLLLLGIDVGFDLSELAARPKLMLKLTCVLTLTLNGIVLSAWCFPRLSGRKPLTRTEAFAVMTLGAVSTCSWLMAAFIGVARPLGQYPFSQLINLYIAAIVVAVICAIALRKRAHTIWRSISPAPIGQGSATNDLGGAAPADSANSSRGVATMDADRVSRRSGAPSAATARMTLPVAVALLPVLLSSAVSDAISADRQSRNMSEWIPARCCITHNCCWEIRESELQSLPDDHWRIRSTGQVLKRMDWSPDGRFYRCACDYDLDTRQWVRHQGAFTRCIFVPQRSSRLRPTTRGLETAHA